MVGLDCSWLVFFGMQHSVCVGLGIVSLHPLLLCLSCMLYDWLGPACGLWQCALSPSPEEVGGTTSVTRGESPPSGRGRAFGAVHYCCIDWLSLGCMQTGRLVVCCWGHVQHTLCACRHLWAVFRRRRARPQALLCCTSTFLAWQATPQRLTYDSCVWSPPSFWQKLAVVIDESDLVR